MNTTTPSIAEPSTVGDADASVASTAPEHDAPCTAAATASLAARVTIALLALASSLGRRARRDDGAATAEYAIVIMAAVGFAGLLVVILRSGEVQQILTDLVRRALSVDV